MKLLYITSLSGRRINGFMRSAIAAAQQMHIDFTMACNMDMAEKKGYEEDCAKYGIKIVHIDFDRNVLGKRNRKAYRQLLALMEREKYDCVHCNTPIGGVLGRICAHKAKVPYVLYMAHGFHFWKGAPLKNWLFYYTVERMLAHYTDLLITINKEDYHNAQKFRYKKNGKAVYVHGVGIQTDKFAHPDMSRMLKRQELNIPNDAYFIVTAGELTDRKNQSTAIKAFAEAKIPDSYFAICGEGENSEKLQTLITDLGMEDKVCLLGFRNDMVDILHASDVFVFPSIQEGLPMALMEAMAAGVPCLASGIRGNIDLLGENYKYLFEPRNVEEISNGFVNIKEELRLYGDYCKDAVKRFSFALVVRELKSIYKDAALNIGSNGI